MNPNITFFYNQGESPGASWRVGFNLLRPAQGDAVFRSIYIYSCNGECPSALRKIDPGKSYDVKDNPHLLNKIDEEIRSGLIFQEDISSLGSEVTCRRLGRQTPVPEQVLQLRPGYPAKFIKLDREVKIHPGGHLIVPVDVTAQKQLESFLGHLRWFSPDIESLVLNSVWRPGLDRRIARIEKHLGIPEDLIRSEPISNWKKWISRVASWVQEPLNFGLRYSSLVTMLLVLALLLSKPWPITDQEYVNQRNVGEAGDGEAGDGEAGDGEAGDGESGDGEAGNGSIDNDDFQVHVANEFVELRNLLSRMPEASSENTLYSSHSSMQEVQSVESLSGNEDFGWGFVKLLYLQKHGNVDVSSRWRIATIIARVEERSGTREALKKMLKAASQEEKTLLAYVTCGAFGGERPVLPGLAGDDSPGHVDIGDLDCTFDKKEEQQVLAGLKLLNENLQSRLEQGN